jgi:hypothetical protein
VSEVNAKERAAQEWFGYGRWKAPYWFIGMEPGGTDLDEIYASWERLSSPPLLDAKAHEDDCNAHLPEHLQTHYFAEKPKIQRGTWPALIHIVLGYTQSDEDPHLYQRDKLGSHNGDTALLEISAIAAKDISVPTERKYRKQRADFLGDQVLAHQPEFVVCYGLRYRDLYETIAGGPFDDGFRWRENTLCALIPHPARANKAYAYWREFGLQLANLSATKSGRMFRT